MCLYVYCAHECIAHRGQRCQNPYSWSHTCERLTWVLGANLESSRRAVKVINY